MNILLLSVGTRNKIIQYFKREFSNEGKVIAADMSEFAPAIYEADTFYIVPKITEAGYIDKIFEICKKEKVSGVLSLIDPELSLLAKYEKNFNSIGVTVLGSPYTVCEKALNKYEMYLWLRNHGYKCAKSYIDKVKFFRDVEKGKIHYPVFIKPIHGSASISVSKVYDKETVEYLFRHSDGLLVQEFLEGDEIGADCYIDMISGKVVSIFTKKKLVMRAGETDKSVSFKDEKLNELIIQFTEKMGYRGPIDIDIFNIRGEYYISEVNPRFGGGYPHAYECGMNYMKLIKNNLKNIQNNAFEQNYEEDIYMMKYNEIKLLRTRQNVF